MALLGAPVDASPPSLVLGLSATTAILFTFQVRNQISLTRTFSKTASTTLLSTFVALSQGPSLIIAALALGSLGDACLAWDDGDGAFLCGLSSFLVAHLLYIKAFIDVGGGTERFLADSWRVSLAAVMGLFAPALNLLMMPRVGRKLQAPVAVYSVVIFLMFLSVLAVDDGRVVGGALLFTASDAILATDRFLVGPSSRHRVWMQYSVWILYYSGQFLIALGVTR
jgi:uncharacterized membrane protein YhhN